MTYLYKQEIRKNKKRHIAAFCSASSDADVVPAFCGLNGISETVPLNRDGHFEAYAVP